MRLAAVGVLLLLVGVTRGAGDQYPRPDLLIEPAELAEALGRNTYLVLDARDKSAYAGGKVPGAIWVDAGQWAKLFQDGKDVEGWHKRLGELGITAQSKVVVYDDNRSKDAARVWWILRYWGVQDARLLHGMWKGWKAGSHPVNQEMTVATTAVFRGPPRAEILATKQELLDSLEKQALQIVDARSRAEHTGQKSLDNKKAGCIPGAKNLDWENLIEEKTHRFKNPTELKKLFAEAHVDLNKPLAVYCQSGGRSSVMDFALELMGAARVKNYHASWGEWGNAEDTPVMRPAN